MPCRCAAPRLLGQRRDPAAATRSNSAPASLAAAFLPGGRSPLRHRQRCAAGGAAEPVAWARYLGVDRLARRTSSSSRSLRLRRRGPHPRHRRGYPGARPSAASPAAARVRQQRAVPGRQRGGATDPVGVALGGNSPSTRSSPRAAGRSGDPCCLTACTRQRRPRAGRPPAALRSSKSCTIASERATAGSLATRCSSASS